MPRHLRPALALVLFEFTPPIVLFPRFCRFMMVVVWWAGFLKSAVEDATARCLLFALPRALPCGPCCPPQKDCLCLSALGLWLAKRSGNGA